MAIPIDTIIESLMAVHTHIRETSRKINIKFVILTLKLVFFLVLQYSVNKCFM